ncbi:hypothetical protein MRX96_020204 [Rhipicephalus microplus]
MDLRSNRTPREQNNDAYHQSTLFQRTALTTACVTVSVMAAIGTVLPSCERRHAHQRTPTMATESSSRQDAINAARSAISMEVQCKLAGGKP